MHAVYSTVSTVVVATLLLLLGTPDYGHTQAVQVNKGAALARGLSNWWRTVPGLTGGSRFYDLMGGPALTLTNMTTAGSGWATTGRRGGAAEIRFDGSDDQLATPANSTIFPAAFTMALWMKLTGTPPGDYALLWEAVNGSGSIFVNSSTRLASYTGSAAIDPGTVTLSTQVWYHVSLVADSAQVLLYLNCQVDGSAGSPGTLPQTAFQHTFGSKSPPASRFTGVMDDIRFYRRVLSQSEICTIMRQSTLGDPVLLPRPDPIAAVAQALVRKDRFFPAFGR